MAPALDSASERHHQPVYRPRHPTASTLKAVIHHHIEAFLTYASGADSAAYGVQTWVE